NRTGEIEMVKVSGMPIGSNVKIRLKGEKRVLDPGSSLILYTDGFAEVQNASGEMLGFEGFSNICASTVGMNAQDAVEDIFAKAALWGAQNDDQTVIILQRKNL
ncbi:MAG: SpoIIE family protein phosphatase, partial [Candidatus Riflebacteria bacterium]|nr:SpoIIE family protein phosphatase [Candidatus Riflebacteria bacterium]